MPSKASTKSNGNRSGAANKAPSPPAAASSKSKVAGLTATTTSTTAPPSATASAAATGTLPGFDTAPHATAGDRLRGMEIGSSIPAIMQELGALLQQTPGSTVSPARGQNGGLLFEDVDVARVPLDASSMSAAAQAAALFGDDIGRRLDQIPPAALERLSQVFQLQQRQALAAAAAAAAASRHGGGAGGASTPATVEVLEDEDTAETASSSNSSGPSRQSSPTPPTANASGDTTAPSAGGDMEAHGTAARPHSMEEILELMQRNIGAYARGGEGQKERGGSAMTAAAAAAGLASDLAMDPAGYHDPITHLDLLRAMMVAASKGRAAGAGVMEGKGEETDLYARARRAAAATGHSFPAVDAVGTNTPLQQLLDTLCPQLFSQVRIQQQQQRAAAAATGAAKAASMTPAKEKEAPSPAQAAALAREVDLPSASAANIADVRQRVTLMRRLTSSTLDELSSDEVSESATANLREVLVGNGTAGMDPAELELGCVKVGCCLTEAAAVMVSMLFNYLCNQEKETPPKFGWSRETAQSQFNLLLYRMRYELFCQTPASLAAMARCFGDGVSADPEDIYQAINAVGVLLFFTCKPLPLLEKTCGELHISLSDSANTDCNVMPELIAERLAAYFYPTKQGRVIYSQLAFVPRLQVHEHAPGNYTCTIDNASTMGRMLRERLISNRFSCQKMKWRAAIVDECGELRFLVWHRHTTALSVHLLVRTSEPKRKKKSGAGAVEEKETSSIEEVKATSALFMERQMMAAPGEMVGMTEDFLKLSDALAASTQQQHGYRTYNKADDRLVFQFSLQVSHIDGRSLDGTPTAVAAATGTGLAKPEKVNNTKISLQQQPSQQDDTDRSVTASTAGRTDAGDSKEDPEAELRAAVHAFCETETAARAAVNEAAGTEYRHLQNDQCREAHRSRLRAEERQRKAMLAAAAPPPELLREVERLTAAVQAAQQHIGKLMKDQMKDEKDNEHMAQKLHQQQADFAAALRGMKEGETTLAALEAATVEAERRIKEKRERHERKATRKAEQNQWSALKRVLEPTSSSTHHDTLAINDFGSFLQSSSMAAAVMPTATMATATSALAHVNQNASATLPSPSAAVSAGTPSYSAGSNAGTMPQLGNSLGGPGMSGGNGGGLSAFCTDPFTVRQTPSTPPSATAATAPPVFSTQPKLGSMSAAPSASPTMAGMLGRHPGMVSPMVPPSPGVASNASNAMGSRNSPGSGVLGSPGMQVGISSSGAGGAAAAGRSSASPASTMMMAGEVGGAGNGGMGRSASMGPSNGGGNTVGGGLPFGLIPSLFSTNPVSHASHAMNSGSAVGGLYTALDANAQPFSPSPPPGSPGTASNSSPHNGTGVLGGSGSGGSGGGGGFAFTVTAGAGMQHPGLVGPASQLYSTSPGFSTGRDLGDHSQSPFSTTAMASPPGGLYGVLNGDPGSQSRLFPPQPHSPNEVLSFSTGLQWRN